MKSTLVLCSFLIGVLAVSNVECTHKLLGGLLLGGGLNPFQQGSHQIPGFEIFDDFFNVFEKIFGDVNEGVNVFLDGLINAIPNLLGQFQKFMGPLSQIPDNADLPSILGDKFKDKADIFGLLVQLSKKYCTQEQCQKGSGGDHQKVFGELFSNLDGFNSGFEGLLNSLGKGQHNQIFETLSKLPENFDPSSLLGKQGSSGGGDGFLSREDLLPILSKFAKSKCSSGCDKS